MVDFRVLNYKKWDLRRRRSTTTFRLATSDFLRESVRFDSYRAEYGGRMAYTLIASGWTPPLLYAKRCES